MCDDNARSGFNLRIIHLIGNIRLFWDYHELGAPIPVTSIGIIFFVLLLADRNIFQLVFIQKTGTRGRPETLKDIIKIVQFLAGHGFCLLNKNQLEKYPISQEAVQNMIAKWIVTG